MQAPLAKVEGVELRVEVAPIRLRHPRICSEDVDDVALQHTAANELHRRDADALLKTFRCLRVEVAGHIATDVEPMPDRSEPGEDASLAQQWTHETKIVEVRPPIIRVVEEKSVVLGKVTVPSDFVDDGLDRECHRPDKDRQAGCSLHERGARLRVIDAMAGIMRLGDDGIERGAVERRVHLIGDLDKPAVEDRERNGIDHGL